MTVRPKRIVDAHVHLWDPANVEWYPYLGGGRDLGLGDVTGMARRFDVRTYRDESAGWNVEALVNVAAATGRHSVAETLEMERRAEADGQPAALVGGLPSTETTAQAVEVIDEQMAATRLRGVRPMSPNGPAVPPDDVLRALSERGLLFELMAHPDELVDAARRLSTHHELVVVVEHTGWPRSIDPAERASWSAGMRALAASGPNVHCKVSGLAMPLGGIDAVAFRPWVEPVIDLFGVDRCMFASNFPVDGLHGTLDELWSTYAELTAGFDHADRDRIFAGNAERVYSPEANAAAPAR